MTEAAEQEEVTEQKEYEERKDEYEERLGEYIETVRVVHDTSINTLQFEEYIAVISNIENCKEDERIDHEETKNIIEDLFKREILEKCSYDIPRYRTTIELLAYQINKFSRY